MDFGNEYWLTMIEVGEIADNLRGALPDRNWMQLLTGSTDFGVIPWATTPPPCHDIRLRP